MGRCRGQVLAWRGGLRVPDQGREARVTVSVIAEAPVELYGIDAYERGDR